MMQEGDLLQAETLEFESLEQHVMNILLNKRACVCAHVVVIVLHIICLEKINIRFMLS